MTIRCKFTENPEPVTLTIRRPIEESIERKDWERLFHLMVMSVDYPGLLTLDEQAFILGVLRQVYGVDINEPAPTYLCKDSRPFYVYAYYMNL